MKKVSTRPHAGAIKSTESLSRRIHEAIAASGKSQAAIAREMGITQSAITQWLTGQTKNLKADTAVALEQVTGVAAAWIATGWGPKFASSAHSASHASQPVAAARLQDLDRTQFLVALEVIAEQCHSLAQLLMAAERNADALSEQDLITHISIAANAVKGIGALADSTSGNSVYGGLHTWMCGPNFSSDDKAVQA